MRAILTFMAMAVLVVSIGCDKKTADPVTPKKTPEKVETDADKGDGAATSNTTETQTVALKLPGMT